MNFAKLNGSGNDFILVDGTGGLLSGVDLSALAKRVCRRKFSIGADGLIVLVKSSEADFAWRFYNADGSAAEMCGNGARCAARFARDRGLAKDRMSFVTGAGIIKAAIKQDRVKVQMTDPFDFKSEFLLQVGPDEYKTWFVNTGVPHAVILVENIDGFPAVKQGRLVREHERFAPQGANANFIGRRDDGSIKVRTYERGVEDETFACGTGSVASALVAARLGLAASPVKVETSGGNELTVHFSGEWPDNKEVFLEGDARLIFEGRWRTDALLDD